jgi:hypothetical protein
MDLPGARIGGAARVGVARDRLFRLPTGSRDVTIDGRQQTLWQY